jgi:tRNA-splicing ligase RtcB (3'-phosphate/5'-hydroxy nucleic acid ligase)
LRHSACFGDFLEKISDGIWEMPMEGHMRVAARVFATDKMMSTMGKDRTFGQLRNVASLPGIVGKACLMPDGHEGYGFPIGGVAAFDPEQGGVVSPGGVGYDINCGVRLIATQLKSDEVRAKMRPLIDLLFKNVPSGVGSKGKLRVTERELDEAVTRGIDWAIDSGYGTRADKERTEEGGRMEGADPSAVTEKAKKRGLPQFGTVGAGNHFVEIQDVQEIMLPEVAEKFGVKKGNAVVMIHCGSRGFGHQVCDDSLRDMLAASRKYKIELPDPELCCAPINSPEAEKYLKGMRCAVNYAFCNRHIMMHWVRETFDEVFGKGTSDQMPLVYDVCHNIAKFEEHTIDGQRKKVCVHRKGATRAFAAGRMEVPAIYRDIGQPVIIPGSMGTSSYLLVGKQGAMDNTFGSSCHGAGRAMSRKQAIHTWKGNAIAGELASRGILVKSTESELLAEEAPGAYKDVDEVVLSVKAAGITDIVAKLLPMGVVKG